MQLIGLALLVAVVFYGFAERDMTTVSAFDLHAFVVVIGGSATAVLTASSPLTSLRTLTALRELIPGAGVMTKGTDAIEKARQEFATLWRDGRRAQAVSFAEGSSIEPIRKMLQLVLARSSQKRIDTVFMELRHAEVAHADAFSAGQENVHAFDVPVQDFLGVQVLQSQAHLNEELPNLGFGQQTTHLLLDQGVEVAPVTVLHHDVQSFFLNEGVVVLHDVRT